MEKKTENNLSQEEKRNLDKLMRWTKSKSRRYFLYFLSLMLIAIFFYFTTMFILGGINWKELFWIALIYMVILIGLAALYNLEKNLSFLIKLIEKLLSQ